MSDGEDTYNNSHRAFLQAFLGRSVLTKDEMNKVLAAILSVHENRPILPSEITPQDITHYTTNLLPRLTPLDLEIRHTRSQADRSDIWALVNSASDPMTQLATVRSAGEMAYVKRLLDAMFETNNTRRAEVCAVDGMGAMRLARVSRQSGVNGEGDGGEEQGQGGSLTIGQAEKVLGDLVAEGWFERSRRGWYSLAPRGLMELRGWLKESYNEEGEGGEVRVRDCEACREIVTVGQRCSNRDCDCRLHNICTQQFFRNQPPNNRKCPRCKSDWTGNDFVGEKAVITGGAHRRTTAGSSRRTTNGAVDEDDDDDDED